MNAGQPADPSQWNRLGALEPGARTVGEERQVIAGIPAVSQPVRLARDEWVCADCGAPITEAGEEYRMIHEMGCSVIAALMRQVRG